MALFGEALIRLFTSGIFSVCSISPKRAVNHSSLLPQGQGELKINRNEFMSSLWQKNNKLIIKMPLKDKYLKRN